MSKPSEIINQLVTQLQNSSALSYLSDNAIFKGVRESVTIYPCVIIEPTRNAEQNITYGRQDNLLKVTIAGFIKVFDKDKQICGDSNVKGILDLENDLKIALSSDITLGGYAINTIILESGYDFEEYPIRSVAIDLEILYRQISTTRT